jgi:hypothetical protein
MLDHSTQVQRHPHAERGVDLYETPDVAVEALLRVERLPLRIWEPACGPGRLVNVLRAHGHEVVATDLIDYGTDVSAGYGRDFLQETKAPDGVETIVTNPPYMLAEEFVGHALALCPRVFMLLRFAFFESERRRGILEGRGLARIHVFRKRLPMMHRAGWEGRKANSGMAFAWFVWERPHRGPSTVHRISWDRPEPAAAALGQRGRPRKESGKGANGTFKRGSNSRAYIVARLLRDGYAGLAEAVQAGRISARAARAATRFRRSA